MYMYLLKMYMQIKEVKKEFRYVCIPINVYIQKILQKVVYIYIYMYAHVQPYTNIYACM